MKKPFIVTERAGGEVAGMKSPGARSTIMLSDKQAEHPLRIGDIKVPEAEETAEVQEAAEEVPPASDAKKK